MTEEENIKMTYEDFNKLSDIIYEALGDGLFGDGLIDSIHDSIMQDLELEILIVDDEEET